MITYCYVSTKFFSSTSKNKHLSASFLLTHMSQSEYIYLNQQLPNSPNEICKTNNKLTALYSAHASCFCSDIIKIIFKALWKQILYWLPKPTCLPHPMNHYQNCQLHACTVQWDWDRTTFLIHQKSDSVAKTYCYHMQTLILLRLEHSVSCWQTNMNLLNMF